MHAPSFALIRLTRTLLDDDHPWAGGAPPDIRHDTGRVVVDYDCRMVAERPVVRTYTAQIAVPNDRRCSWDLPLGDDYRLLVETKGFTADGDGLIVDGRVISNYQTHLGPRSAFVGPNALHLHSMRLPVGESSAVGVLDDEVTGRIFREYQEIEVEAIVVTPPNSFARGTEESATAQERRWGDWSSIRKSGLR